jgi:putative IMPACT (imprinted ancient) family translation regulator
VTETYRTVAGPGRSRSEVRGSEFLGYVSPADSVGAAEAFVERVRAEHDDATHIVPAYRVPAGDPSSRTRTPSSGPEHGDGDTHGRMLREYGSDDGEPTGSAGKPALNVLVQRDLRNVVAVVARYYGGTNLGVGGLARAYSRAVARAVDDAGAVEERPHERFVAGCEYDDSGSVRGILESAGVEFDAEYAEDVRFEVRVPTAEADELRDRLRSATSGRVEIS